MRELLKSKFHVIANEIRLARQNLTDKTFLLVEGSSDARFYKQLLNIECQIINSYGKENAIKALDELLKSSFCGVLAIVDKDFDFLENTEKQENENLLFTDTHDLETMILSSPALEKLLNFVGSAEKLQGKNVRQSLLESGRPIGYLRLISKQKNLSLKFENLAFTQFINKDDLVLDIDNLIQTVKNNSQKPQLNVASIKTEINDFLKKDEHSPWLVCCGHDLVLILGIGLQKLFGSKKSSDVEENNLSERLFIAYESSHFKQTQLYQSIILWEQRNFPFEVFCKN